LLLIEQREEKEMEKKTKTSFAHLGRATITINGPERLVQDALRSLIDRGDWYVRDEGNPRSVEVAPVFPTKDEDDD
jgi:hypothetical protein